jgi:hypothetical protein
MEVQIWIYNEKLKNVRIFCELKRNTTKNYRKSITKAMKRHRLTKQVAIKRDKAHMMEGTFLYMYITRNYQSLRSIITHLSTLKLESALSLKS